MSIGKYNSCLHTQYWEQTPAAAATAPMVEGYVETEPYDTDCVIKHHKREFQRLSSLFTLDRKLANLQQPQS